MLKMNLEYKKGILFVRLNGNLNTYTSSSLIDYTMPIINKYQVKYLVINLNEIKELDGVGFDTLLTLKNNMFESRGNILFIDKNNTNKMKLERLMALDVLNV